MFGRQSINQRHSSGMTQMHNESDWSKIAVETYIFYWSQTEKAKQPRVELGIRLIRPLL